MRFEEWNNHFHVSRETFEKLKCYHDLLIKWQKTINLISPHTIHDIWNRHILDSVQFISYIPDRAETLIDIGSGAGFPGIIIAIMTDKAVHLIESDHRKCIFLKEVGRELSLNLVIHNQRIETTELPPADIISARACSSLLTLLNWTQKLRSEKTICLFAKGKNYDKEIEEAKTVWSFRYDAKKSITNDQAAILVLSQIHQ